MRERKREVRLRVNAKVVYLLLRLLWWMEKGECEGFLWDKKELSASGINSMGIVV